MLKNLPKDYWIYEAPFQTGIPSSQLFVHYFDALPSKIKLKENFSYEVISFIMSKGYKMYIKTLANVNRKDQKNEEILLINEEEKIMIECIYDTKSNDTESLEISVYYNSLEIKDVDIQIVDEIKQKYSKKEKRSDIKLLKSENGYLDTEDFMLNIPEVDIALNYGSKFQKIHDVIVKRLNTKNDSGIILFHGDPGTGKTTYIKLLTSLVESKDVIFVPPSTAEALSEPSIIPFLMDHKNSILIIEDGEKVIADRESGNGSSIGVSNILNLTDGILGDCLNIQIIVTFNMNKEKIDKALLRKGRLIAEHKFVNLTIDETNALLKHLGKDKVSDKGLSLAEIYNIDTELIIEEDKRKKLGLV